MEEKRQDLAPLPPCATGQPRNILKTLKTNSITAVQAITRFTHTQVLMFASSKSASVLNNHRANSQLLAGVLLAKRWREPSLVKVTGWRVASLLSSACAEAKPAMVMANRIQKLRGAFSIGRIGLKSGQRFLVGVNWNLTPNISAPAWKWTGITTGFRASSSCVRGFLAGDFGLTPNPGASLPYQQRKADRSRRGKRQDLTPMPRLIPQERLLAHCLLFCFLRRWIVFRSQGFLEMAVVCCK